MPKEIAKSTRFTIIALARDNQPREIDLSNQVAVTDETVAAICKRAREKLPWQHGREHQKRIGNSVRRQMCEPAENHDKYEQQPAP